MSKTTLKPIEDIISDIKKLSKYPKRNKKRLEELRSTLITQNIKIKSLNSKDLNRLINSDTTKQSDKNRYKTLLKERELYIKNQPIIELVRERDYEEIYSQTKQKRINILIASSVVVVSLGTAGFLYSRASNTSKQDTSNIGYETNNDNNMENVTINTTEKITEENITELITEKPTEKQTEKITEITTEKVTEPVTEKKTETVTEKKKEEATERKTEANTTKKTEVPTEKRTETPTEENKWKKYRDAEQWTIVNLFKDIKEEMSDLYYSNEAEIAKVKGKEYFKNAMDFIFFGSSINGLTFNDLKDEFKDEIYQTLIGVDEVIDYFEPGYKDKLEDKYNAVKDFSKEKLEQAKELIIKKIGQDKYDSIVNKKDEILDKIINTTKKYGGKALEYIKDKYINWRNKQE